MSSSNAVDEAAAILRTRLKELEVEKSQLEKALKSLGAGTGRPKAAATRRSPANGAAGRMPKISQRRRKGGTRAEQAVSLIANNPGIGAGEVAKQLKLKPNYMYRVLSDLQAAGHVVKQGRKYSVPGSTPDA